MLRRVSSESRAGGPADRKSDESGGQTTQSDSESRPEGPAGRESDESGKQTTRSTYVLCSTVAQRTLEAQQVKAGDAVVCSATGTESRDVKTLRTRARRKRRRNAVAAVPWRVARGSWSHEDRHEEQLVEDSRWCQCRGLAAMQEKHSAARAWSTKPRPNRSRRRGQGRQRSCQPGSEQKVHQKRR